MKSLGCAVVLVVWWLSTVASVPLGGFSQLKVNCFSQEPNMFGVKEQHGVNDKESPHYCDSIQVTGTGLALIALDGS